MSVESSEVVLVVEDDVALAQVICNAIRHEGFGVESVGDGAAAIRFVEASPPAVVLLDIGLPTVSGWDVLEALQERHPSAVIVISARHGEGDKVRALDGGADDYLAKPFGSDELLARVRAVLRRVRPPAAPRKVIRCDDVVIDLGNRAVSRGGEEVHLSPTEYLLLAELAKNAGRAMDPKALLAKVWGPMYIGDRSYLRVFIKRLRDKLEDDPANPSIIVTVGRLGYRFGAVLER